MNKLLTALFRKTSTTALVSIVIAVISWYVTIYSVSPAYITDIQNVPVATPSVATDDLNILAVSLSDVSVTVEGKRQDIGNLGSDDIQLYIDTSEVLKPGTYQLDILPQNPEDLNYVITNISPSTTSITVDRQISQDFNIEYVANGVTVPDEGYLLVPHTLSPERILVTGPETEIKRISRVVVELTLDEPLTTTYDVELPIKLYDFYGREIPTTTQSADSHIVSNYDAAQVTIPVQEIAEIPLTFSFINVPNDFPLERLTYTMSNETIEVAATSSVLDRYYEISLGHIDMDQLNLLTENTVTFDVSLPADMVNYGNVENVVVNFGVDNLAEKYINVSNITALNIPPEYSVSITSLVINNVHFIGDSESIENLTSDSVVAEIDFAVEELTVGQYQVPVNIEIPGDDIVWAIGKYQVVVNVQEK